MACKCFPHSAIEELRHVYVDERMLDLAVRFFFSPLAIQASLRTSIVQVRNQQIGCAMLPPKKTDVKRHLSTHNHLGKALYRSSILPGDSGFLQHESLHTDAVHAAGQASPQPAPIQWNAASFAEENELNAASALHT
jgi:hypothetical protein